MSGSSRDALQDVWEWSGGPPRCPVVVGRPSWLSKSGWEALQVVQEWSEALQDFQDWSEWTSRISASGREALPDV